MSAKDWVRPEIAALSAYHVADATGLIKLDAMENPFPLPEALQIELGQRLGKATLNRYPDPHGGGLKDKLKAAFAISAAASIILGNGSDELITLICQALAKPGAKLLAAEPSFVMYKMNAVFSRLDYIGVPLQDDFTLDLPAMLAAIAIHQPAVVFLAYPNNPTGPRYGRAEVAAILDAAPGMVVVDEAYSAFASDSFMDLAGQHPKLVVMRTLSKLGLAGIRLGYAVGPADWMAELEKVRPPYNINVLSQTAALFALDHVEVFTSQAAILCAERARMATALTELTGVTVFESEANFITVRMPDADRAFEALKAAGILIKRLHGSHPLLEHCLRFTIGTPAENDSVLAALPTCF
ncbi:histidinol-phosphate transaminase [Chitinimonas sp. BJB300]|uniref:histidinol-phosphate transaminase n=1 Tax=Chitinimonas sp. BJB300 TaxID=1559339 RepID=UPI000C11688B|nr:histidinol-phosphate transaminase [Chitinimonas sp. BJB300]PHV10291.1 histidinol-phosphate transaminase [Chitinimonas sp. BJB300]TSJ91540.1 histidinol-phosphate transaminase [Chitinimonas sp. BJB300]